MFLRSRRKKPHQPSKLERTYSFVRYNSANGLREFTENGGSGYVAYNVNKALGLVVDLGAYNNGTNDFKTFSYLFGPRYNMRHSQFVPYAQFLFGGNYACANSTASGSIVSTTQNGFATAAGGGLDIQLTQHIAFKPIQLEYLMSQLPHLGTGTNSIQNNLRYSAGAYCGYGDGNLLSLMTYCCSSAHLTLHLLADSIQR